MSTHKHTPGPWKLVELGTEVAGVWIGSNFIKGAYKGGDEDELLTPDARLIAASPDMLREMERFLIALERAESDPATWDYITEGTGIATANSYRAAIRKATEKEVRNEHR